MASDGYFTDPLLQRWYLDCLHDPHRAHVRRCLSPQTDVGAVLCWSHPNMPVGQHMDLRSIVRAELLAAQEMREVLRKTSLELLATVHQRDERTAALRDVEWSGKSTNGGYPCCPDCDGIWDVREKYPDHEPIPKWAGSIGHTPDCRLARLIGATK